MPTDLWRFAQALYQHPGVEDTCLHLQTQGADVCLLLCAAWLEHRQIGCNHERAETLRNLAQPWLQQVVVPLRQLRQSWREAAQSDNALAQLREQVKQLELTAEREQLAAGHTVLAQHRPYGLAFATVDSKGQARPFFLVLDDSWHRELHNRPVGG